jgi:DNA polymerase epsilon subunit 1
LKINFKNIKDLIALRSKLIPIIEKNLKNLKIEEIYEEEFLNSSDEEETIHKKQDGLDSILDIREFDVKYHIRTAIDKNLRVGYWYSIKMEKFKNVVGLLILI